LCYNFTEAGGHHPARERASGIEEKVRSRREPTGKEDLGGFNECAEEKSANQAETEGFPDTTSSIAGGIVRMEEREDAEREEEGKVEDDVPDNASTVRIRDLRYPGNHLDPLRNEFFPEVEIVGPKSTVQDQRRIE
jgi:hypothetical protein